MILTSTPNCQCGTCRLINKVNNISNLKDLLEARDQYKQHRKGVYGHKMDLIKKVINTKLESIKLI